VRLGDNQNKAAYNKSCHSLPAAAGTPLRGAHAHPRYVKISISANGEKMNRMEIVLIGPIGAGKSTIGKTLSEKMNIPQCSMDEHRWKYYEEIGYDSQVAEEIDRSDGFIGVYRYWKKFEIHALERLLEEHRDCVIDFGAGHSVYEDDQLLERAKSALSMFSNVVLLLPSADLEESINTLNSRTEFESEDDFALNRHFVEHKSNYELAKYVIYTNGLSVDEVAAEIMRKVSV